MRMTTLILFFVFNFSAISHEKYDISGVTFVRLSNSIISTDIESRLEKVKDRANVFENNYKKCRDESYDKFNNWLESLPSPENSLNLNLNNLPNELAFLKEFAIYSLTSAWALQFRPYANYIVDLGGKDTAQTVELKTQSEELSFNSYQFLREGDDESQSIRQKGLDFILNGNFDPYIIAGFNIILEILEGEFNCENYLDLSYYRVAQNFFIPGAAILYFTSNPSWEIPQEVLPISIPTKVEVDNLMDSILQERFKYSINKRLNARPLYEFK